ncbi:hypothetical protein EHQ53_06465 [Leptospira langatensis]|uniref:Uncharacterized protein n=1 Tax=Leptospira langatensis TaxID=2484983 RepID=A0A5F1ZWA9_9LEPT|nr:hypothetical protein [Leptospira langatensis]TGK03089.1 hypothetical protein EHO57_07300 [Leptospira langatensis]TGL41845.1 hypothetical protein EHQ53_06465 [Leptospira langatensis]
MSGHTKENLPGEDRSKWIISRAYDLSWFIAPGFLAVLIAFISHQLDFPKDIGLGSGRTDGKALPPWLWLLLIPGVDVSHVYSTLFRAYWDKEVWNRKKTLLTLTPLFCFVFALILYSFGKLVFWSAVAYLAVFHFIRQQYGFLALYSRKEEGSSNLSLLWDKVTLYAVTILPVVYWHLTPDTRRFEWFMEGDFFYFPNELLAKSVHVLFWIWLLGYAISQIYYLLNEKQISLGKILLITNTSLVWYIGIVYLNDDFAFTLTNVINHGIPYIALVFAYSSFRRKNLPSVFYSAFQKGILALLPFVLILIILAFSEEWLWDSFVWREHSDLFGNKSVIRSELGLGFEFILVPLFFLPQFTHYILDGFLWKGGEDNRELRGFLGFQKLDP